MGESHSKFLGNNLFAPTLHWPPAPTDCSHHQTLHTPCIAPPTKVLSELGVYSPWNSYVFATMQMSSCRVPPPTAEVFR